MFSIDPAPTFPLTAKVPVPGKDERAQLKLVVRHKGRNDLNAWVSGAKGRPDVDFLDEIIVSWSEVTFQVDGAPQAVDYSKEHLGKLLDAFPMASMAIYDAYMSELLEARAKN